MTSPSMQSEHLGAASSRRFSLGDVHWGAVIASVVIGFGITVMLVTMGAAGGAMAVDGTPKNDENLIGNAVGAWMLISALGATFIGSYVGGRFSGWLNRGWVVYHAMTAWGLSVLLGVWLGAIGVNGLLGGALTGVNNLTEAQRGNPANVGNLGNEIGMSGWALGVGLLLTLGISVMAWWIGARKPLADFEQPDTGIEAH